MLAELFCTKNRCNSVLQEVFRHFMDYDCMEHLQDFCMGELEIDVNDIRWNRVNGKRSKWKTSEIKSLFTSEANENFLKSGEQMTKTWLFFISLPTVFFSVECKISGTGRSKNLIDPLLSSSCLTWNANR